MPNAASDRSSDDTDVTPAPRAGEWPTDTWKNGSFYRVDVQTDGSVGLCLAPDPFQRLPRRAAADYLGIPLRPHYWHTGNGEQIIIPWH
jgi:hypothetical protein